MKKYTLSNDDGQIMAQGTLEGIYSFVNERLHRQADEELHLAGAAIRKFYPEDLPSMRRLEETVWSPYLRKAMGRSQFRWACRNLRRGACACGA